MLGLSRIQVFVAGFALAAALSIGLGIAAASNVQDVTEWRGELFEAIGLRLMLFVSPLFVFVWPKSGMWGGVLFFWGAGISASVLEELAGTALEPMFAKSFCLFGGLFGLMYCLPFHVLTQMYLRYRARHRVPGICLVCGYDRRVTPARCPECGTPADRAD